MDTQPFSDDEKRFVLAEAIRASPIPLERLFVILNDHTPIPAWDDMLIPRGRTLKQCKDVYESLRVGPSAPNFQPQHQSQSQIQSYNLPVPISSATNSGTKRKSAPGTLEPFATGPVPKRRQSSSEPMISARDIRPKPSNGSPLSMTSFPVPQPKKRGRPSKKDVERKQQEAIARGDILPPVPSTIFYQQPPGEDVSTHGYATILPAVAPSLQYAPSTGISIEREIPESPGSPGKKAWLKAAPKASGVGCGDLAVENSGSIKAAPNKPSEGSLKVNHIIGSIVEPEEIHMTTLMATSEAVPVAGPQPTEPPTDI